MEPVVTPAEMSAIDADAAEPVEVLIERAGWAVARAAVGLLDRSYGARVLVVAGKGNNGADGRSAARHLSRRGIRCRVVTPEEAAALPPTTEADLVVDAAFGTGFRGTYAAPEVVPAPVLAVDIPSGVDGLTGEACGSPAAADLTVTFAAAKPGLLFEPGRSLAGAVTVADIGLDCSRARCWHLGPDDLRSSWPRPPATSHKWRRAVWVIGGSPGLDGAPARAAHGAARGGAGYVALSVPGREPGRGAAPVEVVQRRLDPAWSGTVAADQDRFGALVIGPGLATDDDTGAQVREAASRTGDRPVILDGGAIDAVAADPTCLAARSVPAVLTPHDGEFARMRGSAPGPDRLAAAREAAAELGAVVLLKGPTTVVADPGGRALVSTAGDQRLASAGTGDVLAGLVGAALAGGVEPFLAAGLAAELHGRAARLGPAVGFVAGDLPPLVPRYLAETGTAPAPAPGIGR